MLLHAVHGADGLLVAVGDDGAIYHIQGGKPTPVASPTGAHLHSVFVLHRRCAYAVGVAGTLLHWDGTAWRALPPVGTDDLGAVCLSGPQALFLGGQRHLYHHDGARVLAAVPVGAPVRALWSGGPEDLWLASGAQVVQRQGHGPLRVLRSHRPAQADPDFDPVPSPVSLCALSAGPDGLLYAAGQGGVFAWTGAGWYARSPYDTGPFCGVAVGSQGEELFVTTAGSVQRHGKHEVGQRVVFQAPGPLAGCHLEPDRQVLWLVGEGGLYQHRLGPAREKHQSAGPQHPERSGYPWRRQPLLVREQLLRLPGLQHLASRRGSGGQIMDLFALGRRPRVYLVLETFGMRTLLGGDFLCKREALAFLRRRGQFLPLPRRLQATLERLAVL